MPEPATATANASTALEAYATTKSPHEYEGEAWLAVRDLLSDLMHYCDAKGFDFDNQLSFATDNYGAEKDEEERHAR